MTHLEVNRKSIQRHKYQTQEIPEEVKHVQDKTSNAAEAQVFISKQPTTSQTCG